MLQFFYKQGTTIESFHRYLKTLGEQLKEKYPRKELVLVLDSLKAHKSRYQMEYIAQEPRISFMFTPSNTPEFNPIE